MAAETFFWFGKRDSDSAKYFLDIETVYDSENMIPIQKSGFKIYKTIFWFSTPNYHSEKML